MRRRLRQLRKWFRKDRGSASNSSGLVFFVAITLALLNPLVCLIHCAAMEARLHQPPTPIDTSASVAAYLCDMSFPFSRSQATEASDQVQIPPVSLSALPRAVYEGVAVAAAIHTFLLVLLAYLRPIDLHPLSRNTPPRFPPPRVA